MPVSAHLETLVRPSGAPRIAIATSSALRRIRHLERFLGLEAVLSVAEASRRGEVGDVVLAWGRKASARHAEALAGARGLPVWYLEDGWIRSASEDAHSRACYSLLVDAEGVYYDSAAPSAIETFLNRPDEALRTDVDELALERAGRCRRRLVECDITKYNFCPAAKLPDDDGRALILVVDQTRDDASVRCGGMDEARFREMLESARAENPGARVVVRTHPDVVAGRRQGYLERVATACGAELSAAGDDPLPWLKRAERVYVGTSQLGYEALLCERPVTVFGEPFYAGWGLTDDRRPIPRRRHRRSLDELFHAAHVYLARYVSPVTGEPWSLEACLEHVALQRRTFAENARHFLCSGITPWKRRYVAHYLRSPEGSVRFADRLGRGGARAPGTVSGAAPAPDTLLCWGYRPAPARLVRAGLPLWRMEDGFLRSAGLGSDFTAPGSLVVDAEGLYYDPAGPSALETLLETRDCSVEEIRRAVRLRRRILAAGLSKYNVGRSGQYTPAPADRRKVLVVGQVENDESIRRGCGEVSTNAQLLQSVRKVCPEAWIVYRPHPDVSAGNRPGRIDSRTLLACADRVESDATIGECLQDCDELHTMTSLAGFEALMRGKAVTTWGTPFYAGWGLTSDRAPGDVISSRRTRRRTLDELVFLTLVLYPRYLDVSSGEYVTAEDMVQVIEERRADAVERGELDESVVRRQIVKVRNIIRGLGYAP